MAKKIITENNLPMEIKPKILENEFILITENNKDIALVQGRILYTIRAKGKTFTLTGWSEIRPRIKKGVIIMKGCKTGNKTQSMFSIFDEDIDEYKETGKYIMQKIKDGVLYIKKDEKLVTFTHQLNKPNQI